MLNHLCHLILGLLTAGFLWVIFEPETEHDTQPQEEGR